MSELQDALKDVDDLADGSEPDTFRVIVDAAKKWADADIYYALDMSEVEHGGWYLAVDGPGEYLVLSIGDTE